MNTKTLSLACLAIHTAASLGCNHDAATAPAKDNRTMQSEAAQPGDEQVAESQAEAATQVEATPEAPEVQPTSQVTAIDEQAPTAADQRQPQAD